MEQKICQCCAMPIDETTFGTEADGSKNEEYCKYCYENGKFTADCSMEEMIEICVPHMVDSGISEEKARQMINQFMPQLKRWKKN